MKWYLIYAGIAVVVIIIIAVSIGSKPKAKPVASTAPKQTTQTATKTTQTPTVSLATLNAQSVSDLTPVLTDFEQQMATGQADAQQNNAGDVNSAFHAWETNEQDKQNVANNHEYSTAYNKADNAYYNAHQTAPAALDNWDNDAGNLPGDISGWANAEEVVADDQAATGSVSTSDQQSANTALQQYKSDLAKAKADLAQL